MREREEIFMIYCLRKGYEITVLTMFPYEIGQHEVKYEYYVCSRDFLQKAISCEIFTGA